MTDRIVCCTVIGLGALALIFFSGETSIGNDRVEVTTGPVTICPPPFFPVRRKTVNPVVI